MYGKISSSNNLLGSFHMADVAMRYSDFVPRLYNLAKSLGFSAGKIMPSRAFCSDESQGYPIILIAKHFGAFPFNHGQVGGVVSTDRHGPYAHHGKDLVIIHASHVGYDPEAKVFGVYRRLQTVKHDETTSCGKICGVLDWYLKEYDFAKNNILISKEDGKTLIAIDNWLLHDDRQQGLMLKLEQLVRQDAAGELHAVKGLSTSKVFPIAKQLLDSMQDHIKNLAEGERQAIGDSLTPDLFYFKRQSNDHLDHNLIGAMPYIVSDRWPALKAAQVNTQVEFDRAFRSVVQEPEYQGKQLLFISGLNIDISPKTGQLFPLTKFIPWAAYYQTSDGKHHTWEQAELFDKLMEQSNTNTDQVDLEDAIGMMEREQEIKLPF